MFPITWIEGVAPMSDDPDVREQAEEAAVMAGYPDLESFQRAGGLPLGLNIETLDALGVELH
jgi:hypothetical protein